MARDERGRPRSTADTATDGAVTDDGGDGRVGFRTYGKSKDSRDDLPQIGA